MLEKSAGPPFVVHAENNGKRHGFRMFPVKMLPTTKPLKSSRTSEAKSYGFDRVDYVWYRNPAASVPDMFHVQESRRIYWEKPGT
jgi:hypothetical protein